MAQMAREVRERVARGAAALDRAFGGSRAWRERIRLDDLAMEHCDQCILGQVFGDYFGGMERLVGSFSASYAVYTVAYDHGFTADTEYEYEQLAAEWRRVVGS